ncbi:class I SAM-dependent methyltransferase [Streptomyces gilvus]|uniref:class I SAM-dependent methyltransferase n=1 Tax=Streptomyces gilvus TaxID=2920937 RepID=UPI001F0F0C0A|nr:class I SAM-dependent methyltransferase [Streptomyces sp. CME 23]MCH5670987.1 class I SAM-dependent methyltransferase [Streptomyces sp. CME 23]
MTGQLVYWNGPGAAKTFTHPVHSAWPARAGRQARILDYGCGYGRVMAELAEQGFSDVRGVDPSAALIARGRRIRPDLRFEVLESPPTLHCAAASFDVVLLFAVLTCVPDEQDQRALVAELGRVLAPGGLLYVSDLLLQDDDRNRDRYAAHARRSGAPHGVFVTDDGAVCRHHGIGDLHALLADLEPVDERRIDVGTMNGHRSRAVQLLCRRR